MGARSSSTSSTDVPGDGGRSGSVRAGRITSAHGLAGAVRVAEPVTVLLVRGREVMLDGRRSEITQVAGTAARPIVRFAGVDSRAAAEKLRGIEILVERGEVPQLGEDEWWTVDLVGCSVSDGDQPVGTVTGVMGLPSCEVLRVERDAAGELLVPFISDAVRSVDTERRAIDVDLRFLGEGEGR